MLVFKSDEELMKGSRDEWDFDDGVFHAHHAGYSIGLYFSGIGNNPPFSEKYDFPPSYWVHSICSGDEDNRITKYYFSDESEYDESWKGKPKTKEIPELLMKEIEGRGGDFYKNIDYNIAAYNIKITQRDYDLGHVEVCSAENIVGLEEAKKKAEDLLRQHLIEQASKI